MRIKLDEKTLKDVMEGRRNALVVPMLPGLVKGELVDLVVEGLSGIEVRRRVLFIDSSVGAGRVLVGLEWIDPGKDRIVARKVKEATAVPHFRLQIAGPNGPMSGRERREALTALFGQILEAVGPERFDQMPAELLDQFAVQSLAQNHDTRGLLVSLLNSFMIAYVTPETSPAAFQALQYVEHLRAQVGALRRGAAPATTTH